MFDQLVAAAAGARGAAAVGAWARVENAACARRLAATAAVLQRCLAEDGSAEREQWCLDNWDTVAAQVAAGQGVSLGVASHQLLIAEALHTRLPRVAEVFCTGAISYRMVAAIVTRTRLVLDAEAIATIDTELGAVIGAWTTLSTDKLHTAIDYWVDRYDPAALRRTELSARGRHVDIHHPHDGTGRSSLDGTLFACDAAAVDQRLDAMAATVCTADPRTVEQRRADALGALAHGTQSLPCACGTQDCAATEKTPNSVVVHVVATEDSLHDDTVTQVNGQAPPGPTREQLLAMTLREALQPDDAPVGPSASGPGYLMDGAIPPAPLLSATLAATATLRPITHPGHAPPEPRYLPSPTLGWFVRCRDLSCRFPGCDEPAQHCDLDHTIAYPPGPTCASNLKCLNARLRGPGAVFVSRPAGDAMT
jgi:Domain of unknown function (DUF222)